jgi:hypothetical protein
VALHSIFLAGLNPGVPNLKLGRSQKERRDTGQCHVLCRVRIVFKWQMPS